VTVKSGLTASNPTKVAIDTLLSAVDVIANTATVRLAGCDDAFGCTGGQVGCFGPDGLDAPSGQVVVRWDSSTDSDGTAHVTGSPG